MGRQRRDTSFRCPPVPLSCCPLPSYAYAADMPRMRSHFLEFQMSRSDCYPPTYLCLLPCVSSSATNDPKSRIKGQAYLPFEVPEQRLSLLHWVQ